MRKLFPLALLAFCCAALISGCSSPLHREGGHIVAPRDKGLVVFYWPSTGSMDADKTNWTKLYANDELIKKRFKPNHFVAYATQPGTVRISSGMFIGNKPGDYVKAGIWGGPERMAGVFAAQKMDRVVLNIRAGETYFLETRGGMISETMRQVSRDEGERGIEACR